MKKFVLLLSSIIAICFVGYCALNLTKTTTEPELIYLYGAQYKVQDNPDIAFYIEWTPTDGVLEDEAMEIDIIVADVLYKTSNVAIAIDTLKNELNKRNIACSQMRCELVHREYEKFICTYKDNALCVHME